MLRERKSYREENNGNGWETFTRTRGKFTSAAEAEKHLEKLEGESWSSMFYTHTSTYYVKNRNARFHNWTGKGRWKRAA